GVGLRAAGAAGTGVFRRRRRGNGPASAPDRPGAAHHGQILSRHPRPAGDARLLAAARAGAARDRGAADDPAPAWRDLMPRTAHIIGAGVSGLAAGVRLAEAGFTVHVYEASQHLGGRCRSYYDGATGLVIDNGNHLVLSGNRHTLAYARRIGSEGG